jgi:hypothetical protein
MSRTLYLALAMDLKGFTPKLRDAQEDLGRFGNATRNLTNTLSGMLGPALIGAGAAAGYAAVQFGVDGVKAFVDDEAAAAKLATTLQNLGLAQDTSAAEASVDVMQRQFGVADDLLRPALGKLVLVTGDVTEANKLLAVALDASAGTGRSLEQVTQAIARAASGSATSLLKIAPALDQNILKSGNLNAITAELSRTFGGQAQTAANTYQGQLNRLSVGFGELQESFGSGFLNALGKTESKTGDLMSTMEDLQPVLEETGAAAGELVVSLAQVVTAADKAAKAGKNFLDAPNWEDLGTLITEAAVANQYLNSTLVKQVPLIGPAVDLLLNLTGGYDALAGASERAYGGVSRTAMALGKGTPEIDANAAATSRWNAIAADNDAVIKTNGGNLEEYFAALDKTSTATGSTSKATDLLTTAFDLQKGVVDDLQVTLDAQVADLERNTQAAKDYSSTLATQLLGGIDLGAAQQTGADLGISSLDAFDRQIEQHEWFGNVLTSIRANGADKRLVDQIAALGPEAGGKLGQEMLDKGLVQAFNDRLEEVVEVANKTATAMAGEFFPAGTEAATGMVDNTLEQMGKETKRLKAIGKGMGDLIGKTMAAEIAEAVAKSVAAAEAAKTAAGAERAAQQAARAVVTSEQQIAQTVARLINNSNARAGYSMGVPVPTPVLG